MKTSLEVISPVKKKLSVEIEAQEVDKRINQSYTELGKKAKVPGFRPGKIPRKILENYFGDQVTEDVAKNLISETFPKAIEAVETDPLGTPMLEKETLKPGQAFTYSAVMEVRPEFEVENYLGLSLEKERCVVTDEDVEKQMERIREANGKLVALSRERPVQKDDYVVLDYEGFEKGKPLQDIKSSNFMVKVGSHDFHPAIEDALIGLAKGAEKEIDVGFEADHHHAGLAGKQVRFKVKIVDVKEMELPALDDTFAQTLGAEFKGLEDLRDKVKESLVNQEEKRIDGDLKQRLLEKISESVAFELPQSLVESEIGYAVERVKQNLLRSGSSFEKAGLSENKLREEFRPTSENRVRNLLILGRIADQDSVELEEADMAKGFQELAEQTGQDADTLRKYYEARNLTASLKEKLLEEKTLNYILEHAKISLTDNPAHRPDNSTKKGKKD